jgi:hypothetical protein
MVVTVTIMLRTDEFASDLPGTAVELADKIMVAVGGDPAVDTINLQIQDHAQGGAIPQAVPPPLIPIGQREIDTRAK